MTAALQVVPEQEQSSRSFKDWSNDKLAGAVIKAFTKLSDAMPYIVELRERFKQAPRGKANIADCNTWEEFCEKHLHRTYRGVQKALQKETKNPTAADSLQERRIKRFGSDCEQKHFPIVKDLQSELNGHLGKDCEEHRQLHWVEWAPTTGNSETCSTDEDRYKIVLYLSKAEAQKIVACLRGEQPAPKKEIRELVVCRLNVPDQTTRRTYFLRFMNQVAKDLKLEEIKSAAYSGVAS